MWKFVSASDLDGKGVKHPLLQSLNENQGRQTWVWDAKAGTAEEKAAVEKLRDEFTKNRHTQKHSSDALLRCVGVCGLSPRPVAEGEWCVVCGALGIARCDLIDDDAEMGWRF